MTPPPRTIAPPIPAGSWRVSGASAARVPPAAPRRTSPQPATLVHRCRRRRAGPCAPRARRGIGAPMTPGSVWPELQHTVAVDQARDATPIADTSTAVFLLSVAIIVADESMMSAKPSGLSSSPSSTIVPDAPVTTPRIFVPQMSSPTCGPPPAQPSRSAVQSRPIRWARFAAAGAAAFNSAGARDDEPGCIDCAARDLLQEP